VRYRQALATELRCEGREYAEIARIVGYAGKSGAWHAVQRALQARTVAAADHLVATSFVDLEVLQSSAWPEAVSGSITAGGQVLRAIELKMQLMELYGTQLGAPEEWVQAANAADAYFSAREPRTKVSRDPQDIFENDSAFVFVRLSGPFRRHVAVVRKSDMNVDVVPAQPPTTSTTADRPERKCDDQSSSLPS
jgi:hypothetical protein